MIGNITRGANVEGLGRYLYATGRHHEAHVDPRAVASENVMRDDGRQWSPWVADMQWCADQRPDVAQPVWHVSLRAAPEDRIMDDAEWQQIAVEYADAMGLRGHPWVAVRHADDHIHLVACRVDGDGKLWRDSHDKLRNAAALRAIEAGHGLTRLDQPRRTDRWSAVSRSERERGRGLGRDPERARLYDVMHEALAAARGRGPVGWETELERRGVWHRANTTGDGITVRGYSVSLPGWTDAAGEQIWVRASAVDRQLGWKQLHTVLGSDRSRDAGAIEAAARIAAAYPPAARTPAARPVPARTTPAARPVVRPRRDSPGR